MDFIGYLENNFDCERVSRGSQIKVSGMCPFCQMDRRDLRMYVGVDSQLGQCFHCGTGFNPIKFVMANEGVDKRTAYKILSGDAEEQYEKADGPDTCGSSGSSVLYPETIPVEESHMAMDYLLSRGIDENIWSNFNVTFCQKNLELDGNVFYTKNRIIIPIINKSGTLASWQGRDVTGKSRIRYLSSPRFKGSEELFNVHSIPANPKYLIISEGVFDVFGWWKHGFRNVIGTFGKKISDAQVDIIRAMNPACLFMAWDTDAIKQKYEFCERYGHYFSDIRIAELHGKDADELSKVDLELALLSSIRYSWDRKILTLIK